MKKFGFLLFLVVMMIAFPKMADASSYSAKIYLDGQQINVSSGAKVENINGTVMVPIRIVSENLGFQVDWSKATKTVTVQDGSQKVTMTIGSQYADINGQRVQMTKAPVLRGGTTIVPIRFVSEQMGMQVRWDNGTKSVHLTSGNAGSNPDGADGAHTATVDGISFSDNKLMVAVTGNAKPSISKLGNPDRIVIDMVNTEFSDSFGTMNDYDEVNKFGQMAVSGYSDVKSVRYSLYNSSPLTVRIVLDLNQPANYTVSGLENGSGILTVALTAATDPSPGTSGKKIVVIDAGHGDHDPGAIGVTKKREKDFNLAMALKVEKLLANEPNIDVVLTRSTDKFLELKDRAKLANDLKADVFISIHANSGPSAATGTETYYYDQSDKALAAALHKEIVKAMGLKDRGVRYGNFHVIRETKMPGALLEVGFMSNKTDESKLFDPATQDRVAAAIVRGIKNYLNVN
ncbi:MULTISPECIES: N-acetylmuramoyl-L-alanine amidase family protein [unclassified Paenibacillus]|uniref:N-acetylmuramoyl-L-alanine amidase n=1 Tax=unclassified Paenibacillus TaxID=185978 RepID=UPI00048B3A9A